MTDDKLAELSNELDIAFVDIANKYELDALAFSGVVLARLLLLSELNLCREELNSLLFTTMNTRIKDKKVTH